MKQEIYRHGNPRWRYGIWDTEKKVWCFDICEETPMLAVARLYQKLNDTPEKGRYEPRVLPAGKAAASRNEALLPKELKKMVGLPIWFEGVSIGRKIAKYDIIIHADESGIMTARGEHVGWDSYGTRWWAFRRKPEDQKEARA